MDPETLRAAGAEFILADGEVARPVSDHATGVSLDVTATPDVSRLQVAFDGAAFGRHLSEVLASAQRALQKMGQAYARGMNLMFLRQVPSPLRGVPIRTGRLNEYPNRAAHRRALKMATYKRRSMRKRYGTDKIPTLAARPWSAVLINHAHVTHRFTWVERNEWTYDAEAR